MQVELGKKHRTCNGQKVELQSFEADYDQKYPVFGFRIEPDGKRTISCWTEDGLFAAAIQDHPYNLVEIEPTPVPFTTIDLSKQYITREGKPVRLYADDGTAPFVIHGAILFSDGWHKKSWTSIGSYVDGGEHPHDLVEVKQKRIVWVNLYCEQEFSGGAYSSRDLADRYADKNARIACVQLAFHEGEGL